MRKDGTRPNHRSTGVIIVAMYSHTDRRPDSFPAINYNFRQEIVTDHNAVLKLPNLTYVSRYLAE